MLRSNQINVAFLKFALIFVNFFCLIFPLSVCSLNCSRPVFGWRGEKQQPPGAAAPECPCAPLLHRPPHPPRQRPAGGAFAGRPEGGLLVRRTLALSELLRSDSAPERRRLRRAPPTPAEPSLPGRQLALLPQPPQAQWRHVLGRTLGRVQLLVFNGKLQQPQEPSQHRVGQTLLRRENWQRGRKERTNPGGFSSLPHCYHLTCLKLMNAFISSGHQAGPTCCGNIWRRRKHFS